MSSALYYDDDASISALDGRSVAVIGYGIQGRAFAANLRDSGVAVHVGNIRDDYRALAAAEGHSVSDIAEAVARADVVLLLIPDEAHGGVFTEHIAPNLRPGALLMVAHGHSLMQGHVRALDGIDLVMLAPRMYGDPIRKHFLNGKGVPAYLDVVADASGQALARILAVAKAVGFTRAGVMELPHRQETFLDLFQEQFIAPALVDLVEAGFTVLVEHGYDPRAALLEVYGSGEMGQMMLDGAEIGLDEVIERQGSPTCQVGYHLNRGTMVPAELIGRARAVLAGLDTGDFAARLRDEAAMGYPLLETARIACRDRLMARVQREVRAAFHFPSADGDTLYQAGGGADDRA